MPLRARRPLRHRLVIASTTLLAFGLVLGGAPTQTAHTYPARPADGFEAEIDAAITRMHAAMGVAFTGDADRDFARMMIPHHEGAIDMALVELRYGKDERLKRLAQEIIVEQKQEIAVMRLAIGDALAPGSPARTQTPPKHPRDRER
jgi:hypothetical protein